MKERVANYNTSGMWLVGNIPVCANDWKTKETAMKTIHLLIGLFITTLGPTPSAHAGTKSGPDASVVAAYDQALLSAVVSLADAHLLQTRQKLEILARTAEVQSGQWEHMKPLVTASVPQPLVLWFAQADGTYHTSAVGPVDPELDFVDPRQLQNSSLSEAVGKILRIQRLTETFVFRHLAVDRLAGGIWPHSAESAEIEWRTGEASPFPSPFTLSAGENRLEAGLAEDEFPGCDAKRILKSEEEKRLPPSPAHHQTILARQQPHRIFLSALHSSAFRFIQASPPPRPGSASLCDLCSHRRSSPTPCASAIQILPI